MIATKIFSNQNKSKMENELSKFIDFTKSPIKREFYDELKSDKIKINWNKKPIDMKLFLSFLTIEVKRSIDHLGASNGWTLLENHDLSLKVGGGYAHGKEMLDSLQFGIKLSNSFNNYVNPFYLFGIFNNVGKRFFIDYYKEDIQGIVDIQKHSISVLKTQLIDKEILLKKIIAEIEIMSASTF